MRSTRCGRKRVEEATMSHWIHELDRLVAAGTPAVLVTVAATRGSTPRAPGAHMIVTTTACHGTIGGGQLEWRAVALAREMLAQSAQRASLVRFPLGASVGQCCGGVVQLAFEPIGAASRGWIAAARALAAQGRPWGRLAPLGAEAAATRVFGDDAGDVLADARVAERARSLLAGTSDAALLIRTDTAGDAGRTIDPTTAREQTDARAEHETHHKAGTVGGSASVAHPDSRAQVPQAAAEALLDISVPPELTVMLFGAGHVGRAMVAVFGRLPMRVVWVDSRDDEFPPQLPDNVEVRTTDTPAAEVRGAPADAVFLVLTHSHALDFELVRAILDRSDFRFCGLIGSRAKRASFESRLRARGYGEGQLARIACPIGVPGISGKEPEVIAVAVAAEVLQLRGASLAARPARPEPARPTPPHGLAA
jgi:xanthine dehydrogenase accessory factor